MICNLCPRKCGALRTLDKGEGVCRMPEGPVVARAALHRWEEPPHFRHSGGGDGLFLRLSAGLCLLPE